MTSPDRPGVPDRSADATGLAEFWEERYADHERVWSGRVNPALVDTVAGLTPGKALDVGCGEGADVIWLATHGWDATGIDLSPTAIARAQAAALDHGVTPRFEAADITRWAPTGGEEYDLVTASFLHTREPGARGPLLTALAEQVAVGGRLLLVSHATMPPWATRDSDRPHRHETVTPDSDDTMIRETTTASWEREAGAISSRPATGPGGEFAMLEDAVLLLRRTA